MNKNINRKIKLFIIGSRGIPSRYGGFETFAEAISTRLVEKGFEVYVQCELNSYPELKYKNVNLYFSTILKSLYPLKYYFEGIRYAVKNADIILVTSSAGSIFYFLNLFKKKIIVTNTDGLEFKRAKWSYFKRIYLKLSEMLAVKQSDYIIADSLAIKDYLLHSYRDVENKIKVIEYGAPINNEYNPGILEKFKLIHNNYYLVVSRLEPENNVDMIINAFLAADTECPLVIVGNKLNNKYVKLLLDLNRNGKIHFVGGIYDHIELNALRISCKSYIHGHSVGGTNPSLLEAMGSRNIILAHDNAFNREVTSGKQLYFKTKEECTNNINVIEKMSEEEKESFKEKSQLLITNKYNWDNILEKYLVFFNEIFV